MGDGTVLFTVGDHAFNEVNSATANLAQDPAADYGKTFRIDVEKKTAAVFSVGHRNPQGVHVATDGRIWLTEHGPRGGDELNELAMGGNYGWPLVTLGAAEQRFEWPLNAEQGRHNGYIEPVYAWLPSVGISNLTSVRSDVFKSWKGDLLVASLRGETVFRIRFHDRRVLYAEPIPIGWRIRDIAEAPDGRIIVLLDDGSVGSIEPIASTGTAS
jgi:glucose/arabinose dehydrogenase